MHDVKSYYLKNNLSDVHQTDMLLYYSNEKKNRSTCITPPVNTKMIEDLLMTFRSAIIDKNQKKAISILSTIRSSESYTLQTINEIYCTDDFKISSHLWTKAGKWYRQYGSCGDIGDEIIYEESHKKFDSARYTYTARADEGTTKYHNEKYMKVTVGRKNFKLRELQDSYQLKSYLGKSRAIFVAMYERAIKKKEIEDAVALYHTSAYILTYG